MAFRKLAVLAVLLCSACQSQSTAPGSSSAHAAAASTATATTSASSASAPAPTQATREEAERQANDVLGQWLRTQNEGNFAEYGKLYDPDAFAGIRRTASGVERKLTLSEWQADRKPMFEKPQRVAADKVEVQTWHDGKLPSGEVELKFIQRWQSGPVADHGPKRIRLRAGATGAYPIIAEEMVSSSKGWNDDTTVKTKEIDGTALRSPIQVSLVSRKGMWGHLWVLRLRDASGTVKETPIEQTECASQPQKPRPAGAGSLLFETDEPNCSGEHKQKLRVVTDGSGVVVKGYFVEDLHMEGAKHWESGWLDLMRVTLPQGFKAIAE
ncbi:MAG: hypothetical protein HOW73_41775 [Polyangiaceae bacterium]|nr:hypothetical protein [Polyangiaceae bacterium]